MTLRRHSVTAATVALLLVGVAWVMIQPPAAGPTPPSPGPGGIARLQVPAPLPTAHDILDGGARLELDPDQRRRLHALDSAWVREAATAQVHLDAEAADFSRFMDEARATGRTSLQEIQRRSAELRELSAAQRERRQRHAEAAAAILDDWQRVRLQQLMTRPEASGGSDESR